MREGRSARGRWLVRRGGWCVALITCTVERWVLTMIDFYDFTILVIQVNKE